MVRLHQSVCLKSNGATSVEGHLRSSGPHGLLTRVIAYTVAATIEMFATEIKNFVNLCMCIHTIEFFFQKYP